LKAPSAHVAGATLSHVSPADLPSRPHHHRWRRGAVMAKDEKPGGMSGKRGAKKKAKAKKAKKK
jgi:hypothetical protein